MNFYKKEIESPKQSKLFENEEEEMSSKIEFILTSKHKWIMFKYLKVHDHFISAPHLFEEFVHLMSMDLNSLGVTREPYDWIDECRSWIKSVQQKYEECIETQVVIDLSIEDKHLILHLRDIQMLGTLSKSQISYILDKLEISDDTPKLWKTICLELETMTGERKSEQHWKKVFNRQASQLILKENLLERLLANGFDIKSKRTILTTLDQRFLDFIGKNQQFSLQLQLEYLNQNNCRICLLYSDDLTYLFEDGPYSEVTILEKLNHCSPIGLISKDDGFSQYICHNCNFLLENAYQFKLLCEKTDNELKNFDYDLVKDETAQHLNAIFNSNLLNYENIQECWDSTSGMDTDSIDPNDQIINDNANDCSGANNQIDNLYSSENNEEYYLISKERDKAIEICNVQIEGIEQHDSQILDNNLQIDPNEYAKLPKIKTKVKLKSNDLNNGEHIEHICETCGVRRKTKSALANHKKYHSPVKPFNCSHCGKCFRDQVSLKVHIRSHTNERPYICETCGKRFKTISASNTHRAIHSVVKAFKCQHCPYQGSTRGNLKIHDRVHSGIQPYSCQFCLSKFSTASNMQKHIRNVHHKQKYHNCDQCDRSFFSKESWRKHMVTHSGLKPYSCPKCSLTYGWYNGLQKHMKMQHPECKIPTEKSFFIDQSESI